MQPSSNSLRRARPLLGTLVEITATGESSVLDAAMNAAFSAVEHVERVMSFHHAGSDVSRINRALVNFETTVDLHTYRVLQCARRLGEISKGAFDITIAPVLLRNELLPQYAQSIAEESVTYQDLELLPDNRVRWRCKGCIDLGGIAKGYAVDHAIEVLQTFNLVSGVVNAGGDLRCFGEAQPIHIRRPDAPAAFISAGWLSDRAMATSSGYYCEALVDPKSQSRALWNQSVSIIAKECMIADALTKVVRLAPEIAAEIAAEILHDLQAQAIVMDPYGLRTCGENLLQDFVGELR